MPFKQLAVTFICSLFLSSAHAQSTPASEEAPIISLKEERWLPSSSAVKAVSKVLNKDADWGKWTFNWTQVSGPPVIMRSNGYSFLNFYTPPGDTVVVLRLTVSNDVATTVKESTIHVESFATRRAKLGVVPGLGEGSSSTLEVSSTSLQPGFILGRTDTAFEINFTATTGAVLQEGFGVGVLNSEGAHEATDMFHSPGPNQIAVLPNRFSDFVALLNDKPMDLVISGGDSLGKGLNMYVPLLHGRFKLQGKVVLAADAEPVPLEGQVLTLKDSDLGFYTAMSILDAEGNFSFDNLPGDYYFLNIVTLPGALLGSITVILDEGKSDIVSVRVELVGRRTSGESYTISSIPKRLDPVDESHLDPSFVEFKARLLEAVERQDLDFLVSIAHPTLRLSIDDDPNVSGQERLQNFLEGLREEDRTRMWQELRDMLSQGAVRRSNSDFCAPYAYTTFPPDHELSYIDYLVITGSNVPIRAEPNSTAPIIDHLSYDIVKYLWRGWAGKGWDTIGGELYQWLRIETPSGETGYVWGKEAWGPADTHVCFHETDGQWMMRAWTSPD